MTKISISELIQLVYEQIESSGERFEYVAETKKLYKLCKKPLFKKIKSMFIKYLTYIKELLKKIKKWIFNRKK